MKNMLCALGLVIACMGISAPVAHADTPRCVTKAEYERVHQGMTKRRVHRIFDVRGHRTVISRGGGVVVEVRRYRTCRRDSAVSVAYENRRVSGKSAVWG